MKITYRPEIDGLRAIAVGSVILYHAQITVFGYQPFKGGFVGVDIFFVISGYLITSIILKELVTTGFFSLKHFYKKRIRRILPALLFVKLVSLPFAWMYFMPNSFVDFSKSILYSLGFSSNFYFHYSGQQYGAESGLFKPFLHTWSLSVEEQFYILFPITLLVTFKYFRKYLIHILILGFAISLGLADWGSRNHPSFNFYVLPTRGWELLAGSIIAYFEINNGNRSKNKTLNLILPTIGLLLIGHSILFFNDKMFHPSFYTLSPIIGVCLFIWFSNKKEIITKILSTKLFVGIGLISYSLYLWHYPIFAFARYTEFISSASNMDRKIILGLFVFLGSIITYYFIEKPARNKDFKFKSILKLITASYLILIIFNSIIAVNGLSFFKIGDDIMNEKNNNLILKKKILSSVRISSNDICYNPDDLEQCIFNKLSKRSVYLVGDSVMGSLILNLKDKVLNKNYRFVTSIHGDCLFFPGFNRVNANVKSIAIGTIDKKCNDAYFSKLKKDIKNYKNSIIIIGGRFPLSLNLYRFEGVPEGGKANKWEHKYTPVGKFDSIQSSFKSLIEDLQKDNHVILIYPVPVLSFNIHRRLSSSQDNGNLTTSYEVFKERTKSSFDMLNQTKGTNIHRIYPHKLLCNTLIKKRCVAKDDKNIFYRDDIHLSSKGAGMINNLIMKEIEKIELKSN